MGCDDKQCLIEGIKGETINVGDMTTLKMFKVWDNENKNMIVQFPVDSMYKFLFTPDGVCYVNGKVKDFILLQCTGIKDEKGEDLFELDYIVNEDQVTLLVKWVRKEIFGDYSLWMEYFKVHWGIL